MRFQRSCLMTICLERRHWSDVTQQTLACVIHFKSFKKVIYVVQSLHLYKNRVSVHYRTARVTKEICTKRVVGFRNNLLQNSISCVADTLQSSRAGLCVS